MRSRQREQEHTATVFAGNTDPFFSRRTAPLVLNNTQPRTWGQRVVRKANRLLTFCVAVLILLLVIRFLLHFFGITASLFVRWTMQLSSPLLWPFDGILPTLLYGGHAIGLSTLVAIVVYCVLLRIVTIFLRLLVS